MQTNYTTEIKTPSNLDEANRELAVQIENARKSLTNSAFYLIFARQAVASYPEHTGTLNRLNDLIESIMFIDKNELVPLAAQVGQEAK